MDQLKKVTDGTENKILHFFSSFIFLSYIGFRDL